MKFTNRKLTKKETKIQKEIYEKILNILLEYPPDIPVIAIQGYNVNAKKDECLDLSEISYYIFINNIARLIN